ncbi:MAG TPA: hypothetical protein VN764_06440 [Polyangiaceae bacterium]|nr:hypothetical protein [Polyangiaceae bacterium]
MTSHTEITDQLAKAVAGREAATTNEGAAFYQDGVDLYIEFAREEGILKGPDRIDWSLLNR